MKILFHHRTASKDGMDVHITELIAAFKRQGHEVKIVGPSSHAKAEFGSGGGFTSMIRGLLPAALGEILELAYDVLAYRRLKRAYLEYQPDVLYERYNLFLMAGRTLKKKFGVPFLLEINAPLVQERRMHGGLRFKALANWCERAVWRAADVALPVSAPLARIVEEAGVARERIRIIPNGVNLQRFSTSQNADATRAELGFEGALILGFTGFMRPWHGLDRVISLIDERWRGLNVRLLIVGDGPIRANLEAQAKGLGIEDCVKITGVVPRDQVERYISTFDVALQPSAVSYASPLKLFEYMSLGRAIIAPDQENIRNIVSHDASAYLFDPDDREAFSTALDILCHDEELRIRLGRGARAQIEARGFTWDENARKIEYLVQNLK